MKSRVPVTCFLPPVELDLSTCYHVWLFTWALGIQTQVFMLVRQVLDQISDLSSPCLCPERSTPTSGVVFPPFSTEVSKLYRGPAHIVQGQVEGSPFLVCEKSYGVETYYVRYEGATACELLLSVFLRHSAQRQGWKAVLRENGKGRRSCTDTPSSEQGSIAVGPVHPLWMDNCAPQSQVLVKRVGQLGMQGIAHYQCRHLQGNPGADFVFWVVVQENANPVTVHELTFFEQPQILHRCLRTVNLQPEGRALL